MSVPVKRLNVNAIKNNISSKGLSADNFIGYSILAIVAYFAFSLSKKFGLGMTYWVASIGFPVFGVWFVLYVQQYENQPIYQLISPFINYISTGNKRKYISVSAVEIISDSILYNSVEDQYIGLLRVYPKNIFTLKDEDRIATTQKFATNYLNNLRGKRSELVLRNRTATLSDYKLYFDYYLELPKSEKAKLTDLTILHLENHLYETEEAIVNGVGGNVQMTYKELYLEVYIAGTGDREDDLYNINQEINAFKKILGSVEINSVQLNNLDTTDYLQKFIFFKATEEIASAI